MKKAILILSVVTIVLGFSTAKSQNFSLGGKVGLDLSSFSNWSDRKPDFEGDNSTIKRSPRTGLQIGAVANYSFSKYLALQAEVLFQQKGEVLKYQYEGDDGDMVDEKYTIKASYITIPILLRGTLPLGKFSLSAFAGPYLGIGISGKYEVDYEDQTFTGEFEFGKGSDSDDMTKLHRIDFGISFGLIPALTVGPGDIFLDLRYDLGLVDFYNPDPKPDGFISQKNRNIGISVGYLVKLGK